jgi:hypothetical protein
MPSFYFHVRTPGQSPHLVERRELPSLREALVAAHGAARGLIHNRLRRASDDFHGCLDVEDEERRPIARLMLADVARQIT